MTFSDDFTIGSMEELIDAIDELGFVPFFENELRGFSIEEHIAEYSTPEKFMGKKFSNAVYKRSPEESYARILKHFRKILPEADPKAIERILK